MICDLSRDRKIAIVTRLFTALGEGRWSEPDYVMAALADDATWWVAGSLSASGRFTKAQMMASLVNVAKMSKGGLAMTPRAWIVEGNHIAVEVDSAMPLKDGQYYRNQYHMAITLAEGRIVSIREYMDTHYLAKFMHRERVPDQLGT